MHDDLILNRARAIATGSLSYPSIKCLIREMRTNFMAKSLLRAIRAPRKIAQNDTNASAVARVYILVFLILHVSTVTKMK